MGRFYRDTRRRRCIGRIRRLIEITAWRHKCDLSTKLFYHLGQGIALSELLNLSNVGYKKLLMVEHAIETQAGQLNEKKTALIYSIVFDTGKSRLSAEEVAIVAAQLFPADSLCQMGTVDGEFAVRWARDPGTHNPWSFLETLYGRQLEELWQVMFKSGSTGESPF